MENKNLENLKLAKDEAVEGLRLLGDVKPDSLEMFDKLENALKITPEEVAGILNDWSRR